MTCREKLKLEHPDMIDEEMLGGCQGCPHDYGYAPAPDGKCGDCAGCWDREVLEGPIGDKGEPGEKVVLTEEQRNELKALAEKTFEKTDEGYVISTIKDSGDRTEFSTGAVRDMHEGKGRCDLMPLNVVARLFLNGTLTSIAYFQDSGAVKHLYDVLKFCNIFENAETMLLEVAKHFEDGAKKYGESNWQKGIPVNCYIDSAVRHYLKFLRGDTDERHDRAFVWNILCCIWTVENKPELNNYKNISEVH